MWAAHKLPASKPRLLTVMTTLKKKILRLLATQSERVCLKGSLVSQVAAQQFDGTITFCHVYYLAGCTYRQLFVDCNRLGEVYVSRLCFFTWTRLRFFFPTSSSISQCCFYFARSLCRRSMECAHILSSVCVSFTSRSDISSNFHGTSVSQHFAVTRKMADLVSFAHSIIPTMLIRETWNKYICVKRAKRCYTLHMKRCWGVLMSEWIRRMRKTPWCSSL